MSGSISGVVLQDLTGNGLSADDVGLGGATVRLYKDVNGNGKLDSADGAAIATAHTASNGSFSFTNLAAGKYLIADVPVNTVRTAPALSNTYAVTVTDGNNSGGFQFDNFVKSFKRSTVSGISYLIDGSKVVTNLAGNVHEGDTVQARFTIAAGASTTLSLVSYLAPGPTFNAATASQQVVFDSQTQTFGPGPHTLSVNVHDCDFQIDFIGGAVIDHFGPAGSNIFYSQQCRLISSAFGGTHTCLPLSTPSSLSGRIFCDQNLNGVFDAGTDEALAGQTIMLTGTTTGGASVSVSTTTGADGTYSFTSLQPGTYSLVEPEPAGHVDAKNFADVPAGNGTAAQDLSTGRDTVSGIQIGSGQNLTGYDFVEVDLISLSGTVYLDKNLDNKFDTGDSPIAGVQLTLDGTNDLGQSITATATTDNTGGFVFSNVRPGVYSVAETQPAGYLEGTDTAGTAGGNTSVQDVISNIQIPGCGGDVSGYNFGEVLPGSIAGRIFCDQNLNGVYDANIDVPFDGQTVLLAGTTSRGQTVNLTATTIADGIYQFTGLAPGTYTITEPEPAGHVDAKNFATVPNGNGTATQDSTTGNDIVSNIHVGVSQNLTGYDFAEVDLVSLSGMVFVDANNNGIFDSIDVPLSGVALTLTGTNDLGQSVGPVVTTTDANGKYIFTNVRPGTYKIVETQPAGFQEGKDTIGTQGGDASVEDVFSNIVLPGCGPDGTGNNFAELGPPLAADSTATIGFWHNKNGQALLLSLNGGPNSTALGDWLAKTFPNLYGATALSNSSTFDLAGKTNSYIANFYLTNDFDVAGQKLDAQVLGVAFAVYVTDSSLGGTAGTSYGFNVQPTGTGFETINVGSDGAAFGVGNNSTITVLQALQGANNQAVNDVLYNGNTSLGNEANDIFDMINQGGDIG